MNYLYLFSIVFFSVLFSQSSIACELTELTIKGRQAIFNDLIVEFGDPDDEVNPQKWLEPVILQIANGKKCTIDIGLNERPLVIGGNNLFVQTYSGSNRRLYVLDIKKCSIAWDSGEYYGYPAYKKGKFIIEGKRIKLDEQCNPKSQSK